MAQWLVSRGIKERIVVEGTLVLETPAHMGNGDADGPLDMPLLLDPLEGRALLTGTTIAGALRNYLQMRNNNRDVIDKLFGTDSRSDTADDTEKVSTQSLLIVDDALGNEPRVELREGVAIDPKTRTAESKKKFDIELLETGTEFPLSFELLLLKKDSEEERNELLKIFAYALRALEEGEIKLGKRKRRGFGRCRAGKWTVSKYNVATPEGMIGWLKGEPSSKKEGAKIEELLEVPLEEETASPFCTLEATFLVDGSILIRSEYGFADAPDAVHLHSVRSREEVPILSGTSLAGALRARALRIANTLGKDGSKIINDLFGSAEKENNAIKKKKYVASKVWTEESVIENGLEIVQTRVKIDRFTGGSFPGALFNVQPVFGRLNSETVVKVSVKIEHPTDKEVGLFLLLLKDLWTGDLPLGGESSIGRGRLKGKKAFLRYHDKKWSFSQEGDKLIVEGANRDDLELLVLAFVKEGD